MAKIRPLAIPKPLKRSAQKLARVITSYMQNFVAIGSGFLLPEYVTAVPLGWLVFCSFFGGSSIRRQPTTEQMFTQNTPNDVIPGKEVLFGDPLTVFYIYTLKFLKNRHFGDQFSLDIFCGRKPL